MEALTSASGRAVSGGRAEGRAGRRSVGEPAYPAPPVRRNWAPGGPRAREAAGRPEEGPGPRYNSGGPGCWLGPIPGPRAAGRLQWGFVVSQPLSSHLVGGVRVPRAAFLKVDPWADS